MRKKKNTGWSMNTHLHAYWKHWSTKGQIIDWACHCQPSLSIINVALIDCVNERASGNGWKVMSLQTAWQERLLCLSKTLTPSWLKECTCKQNKHGSEITKGHMPSSCRSGRKKEKFEHLHQGEGDKVSLVSEHKQILLKQIELSYGRKWVWCWHISVVIVN